MSLARPQTTHSLGFGYGDQTLCALRCYKMRRFMIRVVIVATTPEYHSWRCRVRFLESIVTSHEQYKVIENVLRRSV